MSDGMFLLLAAAALAVLLIVATVSNPEGRNPHVDARRRRRSRWHTRPPS